MLEREVKIPGNAAPLRHSQAFYDIHANDLGSRLHKIHKTPTQEVGLVTGRIKLPGPDLLLHELERAAEKLEGGELQALEKERLGVRSHHRRDNTHVHPRWGWALSCLAILLRETGMHLC